MSIVLIVNLKRRYFYFVFIHLNQDPFIHILLKVKTFFFCHYCHLVQKGARVSEEKKHPDIQKKIKKDRSVV